MLMLGGDRGRVAPFSILSPDPMRYLTASDGVIDD
jgi:hypothetical protein